MIKLKDSVRLIVKSSNIKLSIKFNLNDAVELQLLLGVFIGKKSVLEYIDLGFEFNKVVTVPSSIKNAKQSFLDDMLNRAMLPLYRDRYLKLTDEEIILILKEKPQLKEIFLKELCMIYT